MVSDASLRDAVAVAGYHYTPDDDSAGNFKRLAQVYDKEVWNSEAQATFGNSAFRPNNNMREPTVAGTGIGGRNSALEMGNTIIKGFTNSNRTNFIYQPAVGSFYEGEQYGFKELVSARDPWSGWIHYDAGIDILRHFSWFAKTGWENSSNTAGIWRAVPQASSHRGHGHEPGHRAQRHAQLPDAGRSGQAQLLDGPHERQRVPADLPHQHCQHGVHRCARRWNCGRRARPTEARPSTPTT